MVIPRPLPRLQPNKNTQQRRHAALVRTSSSLTSTSETTTGSSSDRSLQLEVPHPEPATAPPNMPLPALPVLKTRTNNLHQLSGPSSPASTSQVSLSLPDPEPEPTSSTTQTPSKSLLPSASRSMTPSSIPTLKTHTSASRFASTPTSLLSSSPILSQSSSQISIGAFPRPPTSSSNGRQNSAASPTTSETLSPALSGMNSPPTAATPTSTTAPTAAPTSPVTAGIPRFKPKKKTSSRSIVSNYSQTRRTSDMSAAGHSLLLNNTAHDRTISAAPGARGSDLLSSIATSYSTEKVVPRRKSDSQRASSHVGPLSPTGLHEAKTKGNVLVSIRVRPDAADETLPDSGLPADWSVDTKDSRVTYIGGNGGDFSFDHVFAPRHHNARVYNDTTKRLVRRVMQGFHGTVFAYGMTGTGKTFSMQGISSSPGIIPLAITDIFSYIRETPDREFLLRVSYLEIYNEKIHDLLSSDAANTPSGGAGPQEEIKLRQDKRRGVYATPLKEEIVQSPTQLLRVIARGDQARKTASTLYNARSSRSHAVVQIVIESRERKMPGSDRPAAPGTLISTLSLIDLAGSEKAAEDKDRRTEGSHINKSLLTLGTIIARLSGENDANGSSKDTADAVKHLPYRDSKLTRLLQPALSGDSLVSILCTVRLPASGSSNNISETLNTLKFASRAKNNIVSHAKRNESMLAGGPGDAASRALLERYRAEIDDLKRQLHAQQRANAEAQKAEEEQAESERDRERERDSVERHETQLMEIQLARTALKERIQHLNRLILSSRSSGVNATTGHGSDAGDVSSVEGVGIALGSPGVSRRPSGDWQEVGSMQKLGGQDARITRLSGANSGRDSSSPIALGQGYLDEDSALEAVDSISAATQQIRAMQFELAEKSSQINELKRQLDAASMHQRASDEEAQRQSTVDDKDQQISELRAELEKQQSLNQSLLVAATKRLSSRGVSIEGLGSDYGWPRVESMGSVRSYNFSRPAPMAHRKQVSIDDMTRMLDDMLQNHASGDYSAKPNTSMSFVHHESQPLTA